MTNQPEWQLPSPHDLGAERWVLGALLKDARWIPEIRTVIKGENDFFLEVHRQVYAAAIDLADRGLAVDAVTVGDRLRQTQFFRADRDLVRLSQLVEDCPNPASAAVKAEIVRKHACRREVIDAAWRCVQGADPATTQDDDLAEVFGKLKGALETVELDGSLAGARRLRLTSAAEIRPRPVRWLWDTTPFGAPPTYEGRIPMDSLCIAAGMAGIGKSQFSAWFAARITTGTLPGQLYGVPRSVIYAALEDDWQFTIAPRLIAAGADLNRVFRIEVSDDDDLHARLTLPVDISSLGKVAEANEVALLVADPLLSLVDERINDYRAAEVRRALEPLAAAAAQHRFTVLGLGHFTKAGAADPLNRIGGSGAFGQVIRSALAFARCEPEGPDDEPTFVLSQIKNNLGRLDVPSFEYTIQPVTVDTEDGPSYVSRFALGEATTASVREIMRNEGQPHEGGALGDAAEWLRTYLAEQGGSAGRKEALKAAAAQGFAQRTVERAASERLRLRSRTGGFPKISSWYLPEAWEGAADA